MPQAIFAYHLGMDAEQYAFFRIPKLLITEPYFRRLSTDAKLLYGLMLDRMSLSMRNGWMDDDGHVYIYFTLEEACEQLCCKTDKAVKLFAELDSAKGVGLIRRVKQGLGRPAKIYVLRFMGMEDEPGEDTPKAEPPSCRNPDFGKTEVKSSEKPKSEPRKIRSQDLGKTECNKTDKNNTELSNTDSSIHPGAQPEEVIEEYRKEIRENIEYDHLRRQHPYDDIDEIADLMLEVLCTQGTDEMDAFRDSIACCADDILRKRVEEKYRDPAQPIYPNTRSEAMARGEVFEWMASRDRTLTCAGAFEKDATNAYNDGTLSVFLKDWTTTYGKDRCMFVLACTMAQRTGDERFYPPARQAAGRFAALQKQMGGHTDIYAVDNHSCVINAAMEQLAKPERSVERKAAKKDAPER